MALFLTDNKRKSGMTLIGVMMALSIMSVGLVALLTLVNSTLKTALGVQGNIEANALMYDAFESIRNIRDTNLLSMVDGEFAQEKWNNGVAGNFRSNGNYLISCNESGGVGCEIKEASFSQDEKIEPDYSNTAYDEFILYRNKDTGVINHDSSGNVEPLRYYRQIIVRNPCSIVPPPSNDPEKCNNNPTERPDNENLKEIVVYLTWKESDGNKREMYGYTYIGNWSLDEK